MEAELEIENSAEDSSETIIFVENADSNSLESTDYIHDVKFKLPRIEHINCLNSGDNKRDDYIYTSRISVNDDTIKWEDFGKMLQEYDSNKNNNFSAQYINSVPEIDEPLYRTSAESENPKKIGFDKIYKRSFYPQSCLIQLNAGAYYPFNPIGATGLRGRGLLEKWGANHQLDLVITRWKKNSEGGLCINTETMKPVLEAIVVKHTDLQLEDLYGARGYSLPFSEYTFGEDTIYVLALGRFLYALTEDFIKKDNLSLDLFFKCGKRIYFGYIDDPRNTDNAWIESQVFNFHDKTEILDVINMERDIKPSERFEWKEVDSRLEYYMGYHDIMRRVARYHGAHF